MTLSENKLLTLLRNLLSFFFLYIGVQILATIILIPFMLIFNLATLNHASLMDKSNSTFYISILSLSQVLCIFFFYRLYKKKEFNLTKAKAKLSLESSWKYALISIGDSGISLLWIFLVLFLSNYFPIIKSSLESFIESIGILNGESILSFISLVILAPITEEIIFRGVIFNEAAKFKNGAFPIILSALLFGIAHGEPVQIIYAFISGLIWGFVYSKTHSLPIVMFLHILNNLLTTLPDAFSTPINIIQVICIVPMIYFLVKMHKGDIPGQELSKSN